MAEGARKLLPCLDMSTSRKCFSTTALVCVTTFAQTSWSQSLDLLRTLTPDQRATALSVMQGSSGQIQGQPLGTSRLGTGAGTASRPAGSAGLMNQQGLGTTSTTPLDQYDFTPKTPIPGFSLYGESRDPVVNARRQQSTSPKQPLEELRPFGERFFASGAMGFNPPSDLPVPADYIIGVGDTVELRVFGKENRLYQLPVERNGVITLPDIGPITVAGMSFETMGKVVLERIAKQKIGIDATVSMGPLRSIQIFVMGDVKNPGAYTTDALTTAVNALLMGGGIKPTGSMRKIEIRRQGKTVARLDLYDAMLAGGTRGDLRLQSGDTIFVPPVGPRAGVSGDVLRPAIYELLNEKNADDLIRLAGGLLPTAHPANAKIDRIGSEGKRQTIDISLTAVSQRKLELRNGDIIHIPPVLARQEKTVTLAGGVERPGTYEWKEGLHLGQIISSFDALKRSAYRAFAVIERTDEATGLRNLRAVNLLSIVRGQHTEVLHPEDRVIVLSQSEVDFLSSASVQFILAGRLPPTATYPLGGALVAESIGLKPKSDDAIGRSGIDQNASADGSQAKGADGRPLSSNPAVRAAQEAWTPVQASAQAGSSNQPGQPLPQGNIPGQSQQLASNALGPLNPNEEPARDPNHCQGLVDLADIVHREGTERFRSSLLFSNSETDKIRLVRTQQCPQIFDENPALLPFVLENTVMVRGEVKYPGVLPTAVGMPLDAALNARGGLTNEADPQGIEVSRLASTKSGKALVKRELLAQKDQLDKVTIQPGNIVLVRKRATDLETGVVRLTGEFSHPGTYEIRRGEKLSDLIARAGGLTNAAYPYGTVFLRQSVKEDKKQYYQKAAQELQNSMIFALTRQGSTGAQASATSLVTNLMNQLKNIDPTGRMVVEADPTVLQVRPELDVVLEAGDEVHIPRRPSSIMVMGEVLNPGAVQFQSGKKATDYISAVGGLTKLADENRIFAILPNGSAEPLKTSSWNFQPKLLPPGTVIYVSREALPTTNTDMMLLSLQVLKDLALSAASLAVINR